jgi:opacity protein-like surface antigen
LGCHDATGGLVGGQVGYRWQMTNWVFGLEGQGDWANLKGSDTSAIGTLGGLPFLNQTKIDSIGLFTGQVGYAWNDVLWHVKGGAALTHDKYSSIANIAAGGGAAGTPFAQASETRWGGVVGTGIEFSFAPHWSVAAEYDHLFMGNGNRNFSFVPALGGGFVFTDGIKQDVAMGTVRATPSAARWSRNIEIKRRALPALVNTSCSAAAATTYLELAHRPRPLTSHQLGMDARRPSPRCRLWRRCAMGQSLRDVVRYGELLQAPIESVLRGLKVPDNEIKLLMEPGLRTYKKIKISYPTYPVWLAGQNPTLVKFVKTSDSSTPTVLGIESSIPTYRADKEEFLGDGENSMRKTLDDVFANPAGNPLGIELGLSSHVLEISAQFETPDDDEPETFPSKELDATSSGMPVRDSKGEVFGDKSGTGHGSPNVFMFFTPKYRGPKGLAKRSFPGNNPDEALFHELVHALRLLAGLSNQLMVNVYGNTEEYLVITLTNIFISAKNPLAPLRGDHGFGAMRDPQHFLENVQNIMISPRTLMERFRLEQNRFYLGLTNVDAKFNPVAQFDREKFPGKYRRK